MLRLAGVLLWLSVLGSCRAIGVLPSTELPAAAAAAVPDAAPGLALAWASTDYDVREPPGAAVELLIIVESRRPEATGSTSILWEPAFAEAFSFLHSDPEAWRVRVDERGWGSLDTSGLLPGAHGTFRVWFSALAFEELAPEVVVVADGQAVVGSGVATPLHVMRRETEDRQQVFERGTLAAAADRVRFVPADSRGAFPLALGLALALSLVTATGLAAALQFTYTDPAVTVRVRP